MNNKNFGVSFLLVFIIIFSVSVNAFELTSTETTKNVCTSNTVLFTATVSGSGNFNVNYGGSASQFSTVVPQGFTLLNGERTVYTYITPRLSTPPGLYSLNLVVNSGTSQTVTYNVNVQDCNQVGLQGDAEKEFCACNSATYEYNIINAGNYQETYNLEVTGNGARFVTLSESQFTLGSQKTKKIYAYYEAPCGTSGEYSFNVNIESLTSNAAASFTSNAVVNSCYDFNLVPEKTFLDICEHTIENVPLNIENTADADNEFSLLLTGPGWANLENDNVRLDANTNSKVNLILNPDYGVEGSYGVNVKVNSKDGELSKEQLIKVNVKKCNDVVLDIEKSEDNVCNLVSKEYNVKVKNNGEFDKEFKLEVNYPWAVLSTQSIDLSAKAEKDVKLTLTPSKDLTGIYDVKVKATAFDSSKISSEDSIKVTLVETDLCYTPLIDVKDVVIEPDTTATVEVKITNNGPEKATYLLSLTGDASFVQLNPATLEVDSGNTEVSYLYIAPPFNTELKDYEGVLNVRVQGSNVLESKDIKFMVRSEGGIGEPINKVNLWQRIVAWIKTNLLTEVKVESNETILNEDVLNETEVLAEEEVELAENLINETEEVVEEEVEEETVQETSLITSNVNFTFKDEQHSIIIKEVTATSVVIEVNSNPQYFILDFNETEKVDVDQDGYYDYELELKEIKNNKPVIESKTINEKVPGEIKENNAGMYSSLVLSFLIQYKFYIILGIILLIVLIVLISYWKEIVDFFEEEESGSKRRKA